MSHLGHLAKRFFGSLVPREPSAADVSWAEQQLLPGEADLWRSMSRADRRHSVAVARRTLGALEARASRATLAAGLLHDVGKVASALGTYRRVGATVVVRIVGRSHAATWRQAGGLRHRVGLYADHPAIGADLLERAGSEPLTVAWTREHHLPERQWTVSPALAHALKAADDD
ncbi:MAG: hypothetical protein M3Z46_10725 [Actinomycetota bacterium]|nr:hypothetical protein [Actinomycetota bacterium]